MIIIRAFRGQKNSLIEVNISINDLMLLFRWGGIWGKHMKSPQFKDVHEGQKLNHLPGTFNIGRKDRLWKNYQRLRLKFGKEEFSFLPRTFLLPSESKLLRRVWERRGCRAKWIVKPPALARGTGIKVTYNSYGRNKAKTTKNIICTKHQFFHIQHRNVLYLFVQL